MSQFQRFDAKAEAERLGIELSPAANFANPAIPGAGLAEIARLAGGYDFCVASASDRETWEALRADLGVSVHSRAVGGQVVWVRDASTQARLQSRRPELVIYTLGEIEELLKAGCDSTRLKAVHECKRILGGVIAPGPGRVAGRKPER